MVDRKTDMCAIKYCNRIQPTNNKSIILRRALMESQIRQKLLSLMPITRQRSHQNRVDPSESVTLLCTRNFSHTLVNFHLTQNYCIKLCWSPPEKKNMIYFVKIKCCSFLVSPVHIDGKKAIVGHTTNLSKKQQIAMTIWKHLLCGLNLAICFTRKYTSKVERKKIYNKISEKENISR